jgi:hypothetical protein
VVLGVLWAPFALLTGLGERRRGARTRVAVPAGLAFPLTWTVWYVRDQHPFDLHAPGR